jgi:hypothetical protein
MKWLLVWVVANASAADLPQGMVYDNQEQCELAARTLDGLTAKAGMSGANVPMSVRAACIEVPAPTSREDKAG